MDGTRASSEKIGAAYSVSHCSYDARMEKIVRHVWLYELSVLCSPVNEALLVYVHAAGTSW